jgi:hypothetical protein
MTHLPFYTLFIETDRTGLLTDHCVMADHRTLSLQIFETALRLLRGDGDASNYKYEPHPEERAIARVSKDGPRHGAYPSRRIASRCSSG